MKYEHKELIHDYLHIGKRIKRIEQRMYSAKINFGAQNYIGGTDFYSPLGVKRRVFSLENEICSYVDYLNACELNIKKNERRKKYFKHYIDTLDPHTRTSLKSRYGDISRLDEVPELGHDEQVLDEILEIEEAISHEFKNEHLSEHDRNLIRVETNNLKPDTLEESFETMLHMLGVKKSVTS